MQIKSQVVIVRNRNHTFPLTSNKIRGHKYNYKEDVECKFYSAAMSAICRTQGALKTIYPVLVNVHSHAKLKLHAGDLMQSEAQILDLITVPFSHPFDHPERHAVNDDSTNCQMPRKTSANEMHGYKYTHT